MKAVFAAASILVAGLSPALAGTLCVDPEFVDHGYMIEVSPTRDSAVVKHASIGGSTAIAAVPCSAAESDPLRLLPGHPALVCRAADRVDNSYTVTVHAPNCAGEVRAKLEMHTMAGVLSLGQFVCKETP